MCNHCGRKSEFEHLSTTIRHWLFQICCLSKYPIYFWYYLSAPLSISTIKPYMSLLPVPLPASLGFGSSLYSFRVASANSMRLLLSLPRWNYRRREAQIGTMRRCGTNGPNDKKSCLVFINGWINGILIFVCYIVIVNMDPMLSILRSNLSVCFNVLSMFLSHSHLPN